MAAGTETPADERKVQQELQTLEAELPAEEATSESGKLKQLLVRDNCARCTGVRGH